MDTKAITFTVNRDDEGVISGFSLTAVEHYAECFCYSFPAAIGKKRADIEFLDGKIIFTHQGISPSNGARNSLYEFSVGGKFEAEITDDDAKQLDDLLHVGGFTKVGLRLSEWNWPGARDLH